MSHREKSRVTSEMSFSSHRSHAGALGFASGETSGSLGRVVSIAWSSHASPQAQRSNISLVYFSL